MRLTVLLIAVTFVIGLTSCGKKVDHKPYLNTADHPVRNFKMTVTATGLGSVTGTMTEVDKGIVRINDITYHKMISTAKMPGGRATVETTYYRETEDAVLTRSSEKASEPELYVIPLPIRVGKSWPTTILDKKGTKSFESIKDFTQNGKTYKDCLTIVYESNDGKTSITEIYAPNYGKVFCGTIMPEGTATFERVD